MPGYDLKSLIKYLEEFLSTRNENIIPLADFRKFLKQKLGTEYVSSSILKLAAYGHLYLYRDVTQTQFIIKDPSKFDEKEFLLTTKSTAARIYALVTTLIELQTINPNNYINIRTVYNQVRKKYPHLFPNSSRKSLAIIRTALSKLGYLHCIGNNRSTMHMRLTEEFTSKYIPLTIPKFKELLTEIQPYVSRANKEQKNL